MELSKKSMILGVILTIICLIVGIVCLAVNTTKFSIIMFFAILVLCVLQSVLFWQMAKNK